jgi:UDP-glucose 4-epimerase
MICAPVSVAVTGAEWEAKEANDVSADTTSGTLPTRVLVTGAAGYIGGMLVEALLADPRIEQVLGIDLKPVSEYLAASDKLVWQQADLSLDGWQTGAQAFAPGAVVHCAFQIKARYGREGALQRRHNIEGARRLFAFALAASSVGQLVHFSTVSAYGAFVSNRTEPRLTESAALREDAYRYGREKAEIETILRELHDGSDRTTDVVVVRPASITGPRGKARFKRYGLVSTLTGLLPVMPVGRADWCRQYLHEEEIVQVVLLMLRRRPRGFEILNVSPGDLITASDFGLMLNNGRRAKPVLRLPPILIRAAFAATWHLSRGRIGTPAGAWKFLSYPIAVDGSRLTRLYGHRYRYTSRDALGAEPAPAPMAAVAAPGSPSAPTSTGRLQA